MVYTVIENDKVSNPLVVDAKQIKDKIYNNVSIEADDNYVRRYENKESMETLSDQNIRRICW